MKRGRRKIHSSKSPKLERVLRLFELLFDGNQGRASRALGMSQPNISRIINGVRPPTDRLIELLAQQPSVNSRWLYDGLGEPLIPVTSGTLPVTTNILPGPPIAHTNLLACFLFALQRCHQLFQPLRQRGRMDRGGNARPIDWERIHERRESTDGMGWFANNDFEIRNG